MLKQKFVNFSPYGMQLFSAFATIFKTKKLPMKLKHKLIAPKSRILYGPV